MSTPGRSWASRASRAMGRESCCGRYRVKSGSPRISVQILGRKAGRMRAGRRRRLGLGFVPEERLGRGAVAGMTLAENALLTAHRRSMVRWGLIDAAAAARYARECIERFGVLCGGTQARADSLSGGNLQKFIVGREGAAGTRVAHRRAAHMGCRRRRVGVHPAGVARSERCRDCNPRDFGGAGRALRDLRQNCRHGQRKTVSRETQRARRASRRSASG
jgi:hypothetical protein